MTTAAPTARTTQRPPLRLTLGLPWPVLAVLVALAAPRVVVHDLALVAPDSSLTGVLALVPLAVWVLVAALWSPRPAVSLLAAGAGYGLVLAAVHNLAWATLWAGDPPRLGGGLAGAWSPVTEEILLRGATVLGSLGTGLVVGAVTGALAWCVRALGQRLGGTLAGSSG